MTLQTRLLEFGSDEHLKSIELRREVLRKPLGLDFNPSDLESEKDQYHIGTFKDDKLVGILIFKAMKDLGDDILKMRQVAVEPELQGSGVGKAMVMFSEKWAKANNYKIIDLHARKNVVKFYEKLGYTIEGDEFLEVGIPHFKMLKSL